MYNGPYSEGRKSDEMINTSFNNIKPNLENKDGFNRYWDSVSCAPYLYNKKKNIFITYDDEESLARKCEYIRRNKLRGVMFWEYQSDYDSKLLNVLYKGIKRGK